MRRVEWHSWIILITSIVVGFINEAEAAVTLSSYLLVTERYNDNLFFSETDREKDFATIISPNMSLAYENRNMVLSSTYHGTAEFYSRHSDTNQYAQAISFDIGLPILSSKVKGLDLQITEAVTYTPELPAYYFDDETRALANQGIQVRRTDTFRNNAGLRVNYAWSRRINTSLSYTNLITRYSSDELQDSVIHTTHLRGGYQWFTSSRTQGTFYYGIGITASDVADSIVSHQFGIGASHQFSDTLTLNSSVGFALVRDEAGQPVASLGITKNYKSGSISLHYEQDIGLASGLARSATLGQMATGQGSLAIARNASAFLQLAYGRNVSLSGEELNVSSYQAGMGVNMVLLNWLNGSLSYSYFNQQAKGLIGTDGERNLFMVTLAAISPPWRIIK